MKRDLNQYKLINEYYLSGSENVFRAQKETGLSFYEIESIVGRFRAHSIRAGQLRGKVQVYVDGTVEIRKSFGNKLLWSSEQ